MALFDPAISEPCHEKDIMRCVHIGLLCVQEMAKDRPDVPTIISMLNGEISNLPNPKSSKYANITNDITSSEHSFPVDYISITSVSGR